MSDEFNPMSSDAMFARVLARLDEQDRAAEKRERVIHEHLQRIEEHAKRTNGRVTQLEHERWFQRGAVAIISLIVAAVWSVLTGK